MALCRRQCNDCHVDRRVIPEGPAPLVVIQTGSVRDATEVGMTLANSPAQSLRNGPADRPAEAHDRLVQPCGIQRRPKIAFLECRSDEGVLIHPPQQAGVVHVDEPSRPRERQTSDLLRSKPIADTVSWVAELDVAVLDAGDGSEQHLRLRRRPKPRHRFEQRTGEVLGCVSNRVLTQWIVVAIAAGTFMRQAWQRSGFRVHPPCAAVRKWTLREIRRHRSAFEECASGREQCPLRLIGVGAGQ